MAIKTVEETIDGMEYSSTTLPARKGKAVLVKIAKLIGPSFAGLMGSTAGAVKQDGEVDEDKLNAGLEGGNMLKVVQALADSLDDKKIEALIFEILQSTVRRDPTADKPQWQEVSKPHVFDEVYAGNFAEMFKAIFFALKVSLGSFFDEGRIGKLLAKASQISG